MSDLDYLKENRNLGRKTTFSPRNLYLYLLIYCHTPPVRFHQNQPLYLFVEMFYVIYVNIELRINKTTTTTTKQNSTTV